jgi:hypothetical protein
VCVESLARYYYYPYEGSLMHDFPDPAVCSHAERRRVEE